MRYLTGITAAEPRTVVSAHALVRQLLPSGAVTLNLIAAQLNLHPKALQRRLKPPMAQPSLRLSTGYDENGLSAICATHRSRWRIWPVSWAMESRAC